MIGSMSSMRAGTMRPRASAAIEIFTAASGDESTTSPPCSSTLTSLNRNSNSLFGPSLSSAPSIFTELVTSSALMPRSIGETTKSKAIGPCFSRT